VTFYVCIGYNDAGELLPFQGGTNEMVANKVFEGLEGENRKRLKVHYYVAKDQVEPIHKIYPRRGATTVSSHSHPEFAAKPFRRRYHPPFSKECRTQC
jgi:hypothetical protein